MAFLVRPRNSTVAFALIAAAVFTTACSGDDSTDVNATSTPLAATSAVESTTSPGAATYSTREFTVPFSVMVPEWLDSDAIIEDRNFVTWETAAETEPAVRILVPVTLYPAGSADPIPPPDDYLTYLRSLSEHGASITDVTEAMVGGYPATIVTASISGDGLDGSLGCPEEGIVAHDCYGLQSELTLRLAVIDTGETIVLAWVRHANELGDAAAREEFAAFEEMLSTLRFE